MHIKEAFVVKRFLTIMLTLVLFCTVCTTVYAMPVANVVINGSNVKFTSETGYPFVDENNRTLVPLRITMESAGFAVGYDSVKDTAIVITPYDRIEIPIGTNYIYNNNQLTENDTNAVVYNGRTYLPIRAVLESAGFNVEWDTKTKTVSAYTFDPTSIELVPYSTSSLTTLIDNVLEGRVVYVNGQYYATPEYAKGLANMQVNYLSDDLNTALYPYDDHYPDLPEDFNFDEAFKEQSMESEWIDIYTLKTITNDSSLSFGHTYYNGGFVYAFFKEGISSKVVYVCDEMPDKFTSSGYNEGTFNGIRIKYESGSWFFNPEDVKEKGII